MIDLKAMKSSSRRGFCIKKRGRVEDWIIGGLL
jgi:hypothetical protein